jgi:hypothetical protein
MAADVIDPNSAQAVQSISGEAQLMARSAHVAWLTAAKRVGVDASRLEEIARQATAQLREATFDVLRRMIRTVSSRCTQCFVA